MRRAMLWMGIIAVAWLGCGSVWADDFPGRALYKTVRVIETDELAKRWDEVALVDVRSEYEYDTLHIQGAENIPLSSPEFKEEIVALAREKGKPLVFYCNGHTCLKSYKAAVKARKAGLKDVYAYDSGVFDWVKAHPDKGVFLGESPVPLERLLTKEQLKAHMLPPEEFMLRARRDNAIILDVRDRQQREGISLFLGREYYVPLDNDEIVEYVEQAKKEKRPLFVLDAVGKQVRWLQYFLEGEGLKDYYFMDGGARAYFAYLAEQERGGS